MDKKELQEQLDGLKKDLLEAATKEAKGEIEKQIKSVQEKLDSLKPYDDTAVNKKIDDVAADVKVIKDASEKNQKAFDDMIAKGGEKQSTNKVRPFNELLNEAIVEKQDEIRTLKKGGRVTLDLKTVADMTFTNNFSTANVTTAYTRPGIIELPKRKLHIRELLQSGGMDNKSTFNYVKEVAGEEAPETAAEGATKNQFDLDLQEVQSPAQWIAGWIRVSRNMLDDITGFQTWANSRLMELLLREEDDQLLNGDGTSPNLSGITDTGNFTAYSGAETKNINILIGAIAQLEGYDREANGILLHPDNYWGLALMASTTGEYVNPRIMTIDPNTGVLRIAGVPVFRSTAATLNKFIVGDWVMGANLIIREPARVELFYEDGTNVRENKVTIRVEERIAFPVYGDNYFIYDDLDNASPS